MLTNAQARHRKWKVGEIVYYRTGPYTFGAVVDCDPWNIGCGIPVVNLAGLGPEYRAATGVQRSRVNAASCEWLRLAPTASVNGQWIVPTDDSEPAALITYTFEPAPETGHIGWCWWALGKMGDAPSYEQARAAAEEVITERKKMNNAPDWKALEQDVVVRIRALAAALESCEDSPEFRDKIFNDLVLPNVRLLAEFCVNVRIEPE